MDKAEAVLLDLVRRAACELPEDVLAAVARAAEAEGEPARGTLRAIVENCRVARARGVPLCQDTGTPTFFWRVPPGTRQGPLVAAAAAAVREATRRGWLRENTVDALTGATLPGNVAPGLPVHHFAEADVPAPEATLLLKGGGSENMGRQYSLPDARLGAGRDLAGVRACVLDAVQAIQGQGCAPGILGVCVGADRAEGHAVAKEQLLRPLGDASPVPALAALERRLLEEANTLGVGPMGLGGRTTLLGVKVAARTRLPASFFVTVAYGCWACRRHTAVLEGAS